MIAADTSVIIDYLKGIANAYTDAADNALILADLWISPVVVTELLSDPRPSQQLDSFLEQVLQLEIFPEYWERAGKNRAKLKAKGLKAKTADALIAQSCIDHDVSLLTRDPDFGHFEKHCGLKLAKC
jgi:predicted nucleic acid-binding protein